MNFSNITFKSFATKVLFGSKEPSIEIVIDSSLEPFRSSFKVLQIFLSCTNPQTVLSVRSSIYYPQVGVEENTKKLKLRKINVYIVLSSLFLNDFILLRKY